MDEEKQGGILPEEENRQTPIEGGALPVLQKPTAQTPGFRRRIIALAVLVGIVLFMFILRLAQFQLLEGAGYAAEARGELSSAVSEAQRPLPG